MTRRLEFDTAVLRRPTALLLSVLSAGAVAQPVSLDELRLDGVTATSASVRPASPRPPTVVVEASANLEARATVILEDDAESDTRSLNLVNAAEADVAQGINVANRNTETATGDATVALEQRNEISQTGRSRAALGALAAEGGLVERRREEAGASAESVQRVALAQSIDRRLVANTVTTHFEAEVVPEFVGLFDTPVTLIEDYEISLDDFRIDFDPFKVAFSFGDDDDNWIKDLFEQVTSVIIDITPVKVEGGSIALGGVVLEGNDVVISGPSLTLPDLTFEFCFFSSACDGDSRKRAEVTIEGRTFALQPIRLVDANPLGDLGMSFGYAVAGDGSISFDAGGIEFAGSIPLNLGLLDDLSFTIDIPGAGPFSGFSGRFEMPTIEIPVDLSLDFPQPTLSNQTFDGTACTFEQGQQHCTPLDRTIENLEESIRSSAESDITETTRSEAHSRVDIERRRGDLSVEQGQADVLVLRDSTLTERRYRLVIVGGNAQSRIRVANVVNSAAAIVGNGLNLNAERSGTLLSTAPQSSLSQSNTIRQVGGL